MILNLTQHAATPEQAAAGVVDPPPEFIPTIKHLLTFDHPPSKEEMKDNARELAHVACKAWEELAPAKGASTPTAMIGGAPFFMSSLEDALMAWAFTPVYAFSRRESEEHHQPDGSVKKTQVFRHAGFVKSC